ncbi:DNA methyltransferase [Variovorax gossypii]|jgi:DNA modification methylase
MQQPDLFEPLLAAYRQVQIHDEGISNTKLYETLNVANGERSPVGRARQPHNLAHRRVRWHQQTMKAMGLIERVPGQRGTWRLTPQAQQDPELTPAPEGVAMVACSTNLGCAIWVRSETLTSQFTESIHAIITSPPYPLRHARAYGNPSEEAFVDFICGSIEPLLKNLVRGGCIALNLSNDIFLARSPARSLYLEKLTIAMSQKLGLSLIDRVVWASNKAPGPTYWASITRQQLCVGYEPVLVFCNDPVACIADNRRVLQPHSPRHAQLLARGGEQRTARYGDGAYKLRPGSFSNQTLGTIPKNVLNIPTTSKEVAQSRKLAKSLGLATHGALMPVKLARLLVEFLTPPDALVVDIFGGWLSTALACEEAGRRWIAFEKMAQYVAGGSLRLQHCEGFMASFDLPGWNEAPFRTVGN